MSVTVPPARGQPEEPCTQTSTVNSNKNQTWYQRLCRAEQQRAEQQRAEQQRAFQQRAYQQEEPKDAFLSPQRLQLQLHFQREYRQRQELEKNCRQDWWQRKSGPGQVPLSPMNYRTPSPVRKFYQGDPIYYQNAPHSQPTPDSLPRRSGMQPSAKSYYRQPATADAQSVSAECRRRIERDLIDREREKMIKAAQVIKHDAEKRIRQAKREMAATSNDQENIQRLLLQLLKEQDLAQKLQASNQIPPAPAPMSNLSVDLQYKLATLLQAYQPVPPQQQQSAGYQRKWQEQIGTYKDMLQEYRQGNFFQSHQKAKQLLQLLLLQKEPPSAQVPLPPRYYPPQQQQEPVYQQYPNHAGGANMQPYFRVPLPPQPIRSRRDPRLNRSSQQYYTRNDLTPRLNQSSCQYSEQDITPEIIYQADISGKAGIVRRNSTPRKQPDEYPINEVNVMASTEGTQKPQSEQHVTYADDRDRNFRKPVETQTDDDLMLDRTPVARDGHESDSRSESKEYLQDWDQLQQRSRHLRRGRGYRRSPEERMGNGQKKPAKGAGKGEKTNVVNSSSKEHFSADQKHTGSTRGENAHVVINGGYGKAFPDKEVEHPQSQLRSGVCSETILEPPENFHQQKMDHQAESESKRDIEAGVQNKTQRQLSDGDQANKIENGMSVITSETNGINGIRKAPNNHSLPVENEELPNKGPHDSQIQSGFHVRFSTSSQKDAVDFEMDDHNNRKVSDNNETVLQEKDHPVTKQRSSKDAKEPKDGAGQVTHTMPRSKQQPSPQSRQNTQARGQTSRYSQPPQSQRAPKSQPPPRAARQSPAGSKQSPGNQHQMAGTRPPSQNSQLPDSQSAQSENRGSSTGMKSGHEPPENVAGKSEGTKPSGNAASRQGGKKSPGNTYVIRNSGQRFTPKAPSGAQREKAGSTKPQGSSAHSSKNSSPKSAESKSPPEPAGKAQVSPSLKSRRRRYRRKPWEPDETDSYKMSRSSSAPQSQQRFQDRNLDHGHPSGWVSPSRRWMARSSNWESQPRRRPYQWEESKTAPVRKRAYGQQGETVSSKVSPSEKKQKVSGNSQSPNVSAQDVKPDESSFTMQHELPSDRAQGAAEHTLGIRDRDKDDKEKDKSEQTNEDKAERNDHADKALEKATQPVSAAVSPKSSETGETEEPTLTTHQEDIHEKEQTMESENEESERQNDTPDTKTLTAIEAGEREMPQTRSASPGNVSGALEEGCQTSEDSPGPQPDPAAGKERPEPGAFLLPKEETSAESHTAAKEAESKSYSFRMTRPDTLLEHVLAVLGQKAARGDEESDEDDEDGSYLEQLLHSTTSAQGGRTQDGPESARDACPVRSRTQGNETSREQELQGNDESTKTVSELPAHNGPEAMVEEAGASVPDGVTPVNTATGSSPTESVLAATSAKILRLEEMEDWQSLDIPSQEKDKADTISNLQEKADIISNSQDKADSISSSSGHEQGFFVRSDQSQELITENQEAVKSPGDGSSAEDEHRVSPENQEGKLGGTTTQQLEKPVEASENHDQADQQALVDENSGQSDKTEDQHGVSEEVAESIPGQNDSGIASVEESICNNSFKEMQESSVMPEHETLEQLPENGEMLEINDEGLLKPGEKQDELSTEDALKIDLPESGQAEKTSDASANSEGVPASESGPEAAGDKFCLLSGSENQVAPCFESCESADDRRKQSSCQLPQSEKPCLEDYCEDKFSSHGDDQSFDIAQADGCKEISQIENMDKYQSSETKELKNSMIEAQDSLSANVTDSEQMASIGKPVHADRTDEKQITPADTFAVMDQPDVQSYEASCQSTVSLSDVDLCKQEKATVISPLSALARDAVVKFSGADSLPTKTEKAQLEDFTDRRKTVPSNQSPVLSPAKDNEESDTTVTDSNNHSPVLTSAKDNEESDTNVTDINNHSPVLSPAKDNEESDTNVTDNNNQSPVLSPAKDNEESDTTVTDSSNHSPVLTSAKENEESDTNVTDSSNHSPVLTSAKENEESDTNVTDSNNHSPVLTSAKDNEESDTNVTDSNNQSPVLSPAKDNEESDTTVTDSSNHSPVLTSAKDNEESDTNVTDSNNHSPVLTSAKDNEEFDTNVTDSSNHSPVLTSAKDNEEFDTNVTDSSNHSPVLTSAKDNEESDTNVTDSSNHSPVLTSAKDNEESDTNVTDSSNHSPVLTSAKDNEESDTNVTDSNNHSPVLTSAKDNEEFDTNVTDSSNHSPVLTSAKDNEEFDKVTDSNNHSPVLTSAKDNEEFDTNVTDNNNQSPVLSPAKDNEEFDKVTDSNPSHMNATSEGKTVTDENVQVLVEARLGDMVQDLTNSSKKKSVSFADLLQSSSGDEAEGDEETGKGPTTPGVRMRSPPAERSGFCWEEGLNETNRPQATEETCPKCDRPAASEKVKSGMAFGEILHDKLTAFGYL